MIYIPDTTLICIDCANYNSAIRALDLSMHQCKFDLVQFYTDKPYKFTNVETVLIPSIISRDQYSRFCVKELGMYVRTPYILIVQHDGWIVNGHCWTDLFFEYDYIGSTWWYGDGMNVGNGGFSFRSTRLHQILVEDPVIERYDPEDDSIGRHYRRHLENQHGVKFAPDHVARLFAYDHIDDRTNFISFGFHRHVDNYRHMRDTTPQPYTYPDGTMRLGNFGSTNYN